MDEKRDWLAAFILEPESGGHTIKNSFSRTVDNTKGSLKKWMTIDEYGGPNYLNNRKHAGVFFCNASGRLQTHDPIGKYSTSQS